MTRGSNSCPSRLSSTGSVTMVSLTPAGWLPVARRISIVRVAPSEKTCRDRSRRPLGSRDDADRVVALDLADGQTRVVGSHGSGTHDNRVHEGPKSVQPPDIGRTRNIVGVPGFRGDPSIQALSGLADGQVRLQLQRQKQVQELVGFRADRLRCFPGFRGEDLQPDAWPVIMVHAKREGCGGVSRMHGPDEVPCRGFVNHDLVMVSLSGQ